MSTPADQPVQPEPWMREAAAETLDWFYISRLGKDFTAEDKSYAIYIIQKHAPRPRADRTVERNRVREILYEEYNGDEDTRVADRIIAALTPEPNQSPAPAHSNLEQTGMELESAPSAQPINANVDNAHSTDAELGALVRIEKLVNDLNSAIAISKNYAVKEVITEAIATLQALAAQHEKDVETVWGMGKKCQVAIEKVEAENTEARAQFTELFNKREAEADEHEKELAEARRKVERWKAFADRAAHIAAAINDPLLPLDGGKRCGLIASEHFKFTQHER